MWHWLMNNPGEAVCLAGISIAALYVLIVGGNWLLAELFNH